MLLMLIERLLRRAVGRHFFIIPKHQEGFLHGGVFTEADLGDHAVVDRKKFLVVSKGKYKFIPRASWKQAHGPDSSMQAVVDNTQKSFDEFWSDDALTSGYLEVGRQAFFREVLSACQPYLHGRVADIGCGSGYVVRALMSSQTITGIYGVDFSAASTKRCRAEVPNGHFVTGDIYRLAYADGVFESVICMETLEHLEQPDHAIRELFRVCKKGGHIIITIPNGALDDYVGHVNFWTQQEFQALLPADKPLTFQYCQSGRTMLFVVENRRVEHV